jgi:cell division protein FtsB
VAGARRVQEGAHNVKIAARPRFGVGPQVVMLVLVLGLVGAMAIQPTRQLLEQRARIEGMAGDLGRIQALNKKLEARIARLQDPDYIEQEAREKVGLIKPGETTYVVMPPSRRQRGAEMTASKVTPEAPEPGFIDGFLEFVGLN